MRNTPMLCLVLLKEKGWLAALCRLRDNPALSVCAFKGCMTASGCISIAKMVNKVCCIHREETRVCLGRVDSVRHCILWSYTALGETEPGGKDAQPAGYQSISVPIIPFLFAVVARVPDNSAGGQISSWACQVKQSGDCHSNHKLWF